MSLDKDGKTPIKGGHQFDKSACKDVISYQTSLYCSPCKWAHTKSNPTLLTQKHDNRGNIKHFKERKDSELKNREKIS